MAKLIFIGKEFSGRVYELAVERTTVGRGDHNTLTISDASVSHAHGEILTFGTEVIVRDFNSSNGTVVNGVRLHNQQRPLLDGQIVKFGSVEARLEVQPVSTSNTDADTATELTAVHAHLRHLREPPPGVPAAKPVPAVPASTASEPTRLLSRSPQTGERSPATERIGIAGKSPSRMSLALLVAAIGLVLTALLWFVLARG